MPETVESVARVDGLRIHRFQVVRERRDDDPGEGGPVDGDDGHEEWIVVGFGDGGVHLADLDFEWTRTVPLEAFRTGRFEPLVAGGVPVWGY